jgi:hypothetical protein
MFFFNPHFYWVSFALQAICVIHCLRKGTQTNWIWLIVFLPVIGCIAYIFTEIIRDGDIRQVQSGIGSLFNPSGRISRLEENLRFADSFGNRVALADAYLASGRTEKAIELYESSLTGAFEENEHVQACLMIAYFKLHRNADVLPLGKKVCRLPQFNRTHIHIIYAMALDYTDQPAEAEKEFSTMKGRYAHFEARYQYGMFLIRRNRPDEGFRLFREILDEAGHLSARERRTNRIWLSKIREELKRAEARPA